MGLFLDLYQQSQINRQGERATGLEQRVMFLERDLQETRQLLRDVIHRLEMHVGVDLDKDGKVG
jgi:hypothetical protein